ncbi:MAG: hypothetical protein EFT35_06795, partial [Methanophagales archaeon ANME-1-THS]
MEVPIKPSSKEEIQKAIKTIKELDLKSAEIDTIKELLTPIFKGYIITTPKFKPGLTLYRGRCFENKPTNISEITYPPKERIRSVQRVNRAGHPVFYCSTAREALFFELDVKPKDKIVVSKWETTKELLVNNVGYTRTCFSNLKSNRESQTWGEIKKEINIPETNNLVNEFLSQEFTKIVPAEKEYLYKISIAIAEKLFSDDLFDGLLYPTIPMKANADNLALKPRYIDEKKIAIKTVEYIQIDTKEDFKYKITVLDFANSYLIIV